jgi:predicted nucleotidyltransferase
MNSSPPLRILSSKAITRLTAAIRKAAALEGIDWRSLYQRAEQVIVFGSWAVGVQRQTSDIDVLCIGRGRTFSSDHLHIIWMSSERLADHVRRGSELACHLANYGIWLKGTRTVPKHVSPSTDTINRRRYLIDSRMRALTTYWPQLRSEFRKKHALKVRRDLQRLRLLEAGRANLPAPALDKQWLKMRHRAKHVSEWLHREPKIGNNCAPYVIRLIQSAAISP